MMKQLIKLTPVMGLVFGLTQGVAVAQGSKQPDAEADIAFGRYYALVIGNNTYADFPNLQTAVNDARAVADVLRDQYGFKTQLLTNTTRYQILTALNRMRATLTETDNFLLYYAGHGEYDRRTARGHWLPVDAEADSTANWIANDDVTAILNSMSAKHVMVIADSCYSGALTRAGITSTAGGRSTELQKRWLQAMAQARSRTVLSSGGLMPVLDEGGHAHSVFAQPLLQVLRNNTRILEGPLLYRAVARRVKAAAAKRDVNQNPRYAALRFAGDVGAPFLFKPIVPNAAMSRGVDTNATSTTAAANATTVAMGQHESTMVAPKKVSAPEFANSPTHVEPRNDKGLAPTEALADCPSRLQAAGVVDNPLMASRYGSCDDWLRAFATLLAVRVQLLISKEHIVSSPAGGPTVETEIKKLIALTGFDTTTEDLLQRALEKYRALIKNAKRSRTRARLSQSACTLLVYFPTKKIGLEQRFCRPIQRQPKPKPPRQHDASLPAPELNTLPRYAVVTRPLKVTPVIVPPSSQRPKEVSLAGRFGYKDH